MKRIVPWVGFFLFGVCLWAIHRELQEFHPARVLEDLRAIPFSSLAWALALTVLDYWILSICEVMSFKFIEKPMHYSRIGLSTFIAYAIGNSVGLSGLSSNSVRYRFYSAWGLSTVEIAKIVLFVNVTLLLGFLALAGAVFSVEPLTIPSVLHFPFHSTRPLGILGLVVLSVFLIACAIDKKPVAVKGLSLRLPSVPLAVSQIALIALDLIVAASVLYVLLPSSESVSLSRFSAVYLLAVGAGVLSQIPGGLGVFETVILVTLPDTMSKSAIAGSLVAFRIIYYFLPLAVAGIFLGAYELRHRREKLMEIGDALANLTSHIVPHFISFAVFAGALVLLFSGATPGETGRLHWLKDFIPLPLVEASHFMSSLVGACLLILAWGLQRRLDAAYMATLGLLGSSIAFSLMKGLDYEEALILGFMLIMLVPAKRHFYRKTSLFYEPFSPGWLAAIILALFSSIWLGLFSFKYVDYANNLWWRFAFIEDAPRFLRAMVGSLSVLFIFSWIRLFRPLKVKAPESNREELYRVKEIVLKSPYTAANLALLGDKSFYFGKTGKAFIMYGIQKRSWVALGDPVGPEEEAEDLVREFHRTVDLHEGRTIFYDVSKENLFRYLDLGLVSFKMGEEARVSLKDFSVDCPERKDLRHTLHQFEKYGCTFDMIPSSAVPAVLPELKKISDSWLTTKNTHEKGFSVGFFSEDYIKNYSVAVVRKKGKIVAFANMLAGAGKYELSVDLMRYLVGEAPSGVMDFLFTQLMNWGHREGYEWFSLGIAPFSGLENTEMTPLRTRLGAFLFRHGEHFYNFQGLRQYKNKFSPVWAPKYLVSPGGLALPSVLTDIATLIAGGLKGIIRK